MPIPHDYAERVYAGVLGKLIGVYLGRPFEGWTYERIMAELGEVRYYVNDRADVSLRNRPLVVADDDISGTFTFLRALPDHGNRRDLSPHQIGQTWLNYIIEERTILWWGGMGNSTEHTAYLRLQDGIPAPRSGSRALNGATVAEQIGAQIFIDGWALVAPGDPELAADLARRAASVSHDGAAIHGAQVLAAMEAAAFVESDLNRLLDTGLAVIPRDSIIARLIADIRAWHAAEPDWRRTRERIAARYGYDRYPGNCHIVPNHALIILGLLYGRDDFQESLAITNTAGWDTDCNSGNVGCLLGIKNSLAAFAGGPGWRGPVADRLYLPTADGGRAISDAVTEAYHIVNAGLALAGLDPVAPKEGARFHFDLPGAVQGFQSNDGERLRLDNVAGHSQAGGRALALRYRDLGGERAASATTPVFFPPEAFTVSGYGLLGSPALHAGQMVRAAISADAANPGSVRCCLLLRYYGAADALTDLPGPEAELPPGVATTLTWRVPETDGAPLAEIGVALRAADAAPGTVYLDSLTWDGAPRVTLGRPAASGDRWQRAWVNAMDRFDTRKAEPYHLSQNRGIGLLMQGSRDWRDYRVSAALTPHLCAAAGLAARVQGLHRYYALLLYPGGTARLVKWLDDEQVLAAAPFAWDYDETHTFALDVTGAHLRAWLDDRLVFDLHDPGPPLVGGGVALLCAAGSLTAGLVRVE